MRKIVHPALNYFFILIAFTISLLPRNALASAIKQYDFGAIAHKVSKSWNSEVALYVAQHFAIDNGFSSQSVSVKKLDAGGLNHFIYLVYIDNQMKFVIKGLSTRQEADGLFALQYFPKMQEVQNNPLAATVCLSRVIHAYQAPNDYHVYYFAIFEAAKGKELSKIMIDKLLQNRNISELKDIFYHMGQQISELHKSIVGADRMISPRNLFTVIHDDLHPENTFFDVKTNRVSLIDNDGMGESIKNPLPIVSEIYGLYEVPIIRWPAERVSIDFLKDADPHDIAMIYSALIMGMASVYEYPEDAREYFTDTIIKLNTMAIAFLQNKYAESWMWSPTNKMEDHIVRGKFSKVGNDQVLINLYISKLMTINNDLR